jgi:aconitate hydratase
MINGLGIVGWGVGGIEAEAGMLGQPVYFLTPDVIGVHLTGSLQPGVTATDLVLRVTEMLRAAKVVGKFVEFHGEGAASLSVTDRATIGNMAPEYGATMGFFPFDERSCEYMANTGRTEEQVDLCRQFYKAQGLFGMPEKGQIEYSQLLELDLATIVPGVAGPKRPQDRIDLHDLKSRFLDLMRKPLNESGFNKGDANLNQRVLVRTGVDGTRLLDEPLTGGGDQEPTTMPLAVAPLTSPENTNPETEIEMMQNRPTPDRVEASSRRRRWSAV